MGGDSDSTAVVDAWGSVRGVEALRVVDASILPDTGVFEGAGGAALVLGVYARIAAGALALFTVFVSLVFVRFWSFEGPPEMRTMLKNTFVGNVAITGGLVYLVVLGPGGLALADL
jgi:uncharacterized membrane protein YphA (DoxX/SURF4 family)